MELGLTKDKKSGSGNDVCSMWSFIFSLVQFIIFTDGEVSGFILIVYGKNWCDILHIDF